MRTHVKGYAVLAGVFVLGAVAGGGASYAYVERQYAEVLARDDRGVDARRLRALGRQLDLSREQRARIREISERHRGERRELMRSAMERCGDPLAKHRQKLEAEIRAVLSPEQQRRYDEILERQRERLGPGGRGRPGRPSPGD